MVYEYLSFFAPIKHCRNACLVRVGLMQRVNMEHEENANVVIFLSSCVWVASQHTFQYFFRFGGECLVLYICSEMEAPGQLSKCDPQHNLFSCRMKYKKNIGNCCEASQTRESLKNDDFCLFLFIHIYSTVYIH